MAFRNQRYYFQARHASKTGGYLRKTGQQRQSKNSTANTTEKSVKLQERRGGGGDSKMFEERKKIQNIPNLEQRLLAQQSAADSKEERGEGKKDAK